MDRNRLKIICATECADIVNAFAAQKGKGSGGGPPDPVGRITEGPPAYDATEALFGILIFDESNADRARFVQ